MDDPFDIWKKGVASFPSYQKDFDKAMGFTVDDGFPDNDFEDQPRFSQEFRDGENERQERTLQGESDMDQDDAFFTRIKNMPKRHGNIFNDSNLDGGIFGSNERQGGIFGRTKKKKGSKLGFFKGF